MKHNSEKDLSQWVWETQHELSMAREEVVRKIDKTHSWQKLG